MRAAGIVDTHIHFLDPDRFVYPWLARRPDVNHRFFEEDYRRSIGKADVTHVVLIEAATQDLDAAGESEWLAAIAKNSSLVGAIVAQARLERGTAARDELDRLTQFPKITGVRRVVRAPFQTDPDFCIRPDFIAGVRLLADYNFAFDVACGPDDLANIATLADACPKVQLVVNHMANPPSAPASFAGWKTALNKLAQYPNVACKISGLQTHLPRGWEAASVIPFVQTVVDAFGSKRILFGSDIPVQNVGGGFSPWLAVLETIFASSDEEERNLFFRENARRIYQIA